MRAARLVYSKYIDADAPMLIGSWDVLAQRVRAGLEVHEEEAPSPELFDELVDQVGYELRYDVYPRYVGSEQFRHHMHRVLGAGAGVRIADFDLHRFLGAGGFGIVLLGMLRRNQRLYALKVLDKRIVLSQKQVPPPGPPRPTLGAGAVASSGTGAGAAAAIIAAESRARSGAPSQLSSVSA